jgi:hypothetical protein
MLEICFGRVPFEHDGDIEEIWAGNEAGAPKRGVQFLTMTADGKPIDVFAQFNLAACAYLDKLTDGAFDQLCDGCNSWRYIRLAPRQTLLKKVRGAVPRLTPDMQPRVQQFLAGADLALKRHADNAAMFLL